MLEQIIKLFLLALPIACIAWTVTHEEIFREPREFCKARCTPDRRSLVKRKFFYLFTCEYCFSHYVTLFTLLVTGFRVHIATVWYGTWMNNLTNVVLTGFALVFIANIYMSVYFWIRLKIKLTGAEAKIADAATKGDIVCRYQQSR